MSSGSPLVSLALRYGGRLSVAFSRSFVGTTGQAFISDAAATRTLCESETVPKLDDAFQPAPSRACGYSSNMNIDNPGSAKALWSGNLKSYHAKAGAGATQPRRCFSSQQLSDTGEKHNDWKSLWNKLRKDEDNLMESLCEEDVQTLRKMQQARRAGDGHTAQKILSDLCQNYVSRSTVTESNDRHPLVAMPSFNIVFNAWWRSQDPKAPEKAEEFLAKMWEWHEMGRLPASCKPNASCYIIVMRCWIKNDNESGKRGRKPFDASARIDALLQDARRRARAGDDTMRTDTMSYFWLMSSYATQGKVEECRSVMRMMEEDYEAGISKDQPSASLSDKLVHAWRYSQSRDAPLRAQEVFEKMLLDWFDGRHSTGPDNLTILHLVTCWTKSNHLNKAERAERVLLDARKRFLENRGIQTPPNFKIFTKVMDCYAQTGNVEKVEGLLQLALSDSNNGIIEDEPNSFLFSVLLKALSNSNLLDVPERAEAVLADMWARYDDGNASCKPTEVTYTSLLSCWMRSHRENAGENAERILRDMASRSMKPLTRHYNVVCHTWSVSRHVDSVDKIKALIAEMISLNIIVETQTYNAFFMALAESSVPNQGDVANDMLMTMREKRVEHNECTRNALKKIAINSARSG